MNGVAALVSCGFAAAVAMALVPPAIAAGLDVKTVNIDKQTDTADIEVAYPKTGTAVIDQLFAGWATGMVADFEKTAKEDFDAFKEDNNGDTPPWSYSLSLGFEVPRNDDQLLVVDFDEEVFTGGAHPNHDIVTFNFMMPDGWQVFLPEIFKRQALAKISALAIADLTEQLLGPDAMSDPDWIKTGAGPQWSNFDDFLLLPDSLVIRFPPYQVAAYAAGEQKVEIPLSSLSGLMRDDWRTPAPSFDCAKAASPTEKAICADVPLARLDRDVSDAYASALTSTGDGGGVERIQNEQRAWVKKRDTCGGDVACLTRSYQSRLKSLQG